MMFAAVPDRYPVILNYADLLALQIMPASTRDLQSADLMMQRPALDQHRDQPVKRDL